MVKVKILIVASFNKGRFAPFILEQADTLKKAGCRGACGYPKPPLWCPKPRESQKKRFFLKKSGENICTVQGAVVILHRFSAHEDLFRVERFF